VIEKHLAYLNLGSNIEPEKNLVSAVKLLHKYGEVLRVSNAWESRSVGAKGPNYLNACVLLQTPLTQTTLKETILRPIETRLGRTRSDNKYAPRTIDIDIVLFDDRPFNDKFWRFAFVIVPLAEIHPDYQNPIDQENLKATANRLSSDIWIEKRSEVLSQFSGNRLKD